MQTSAHCTAGITDGKGQEGMNPIISIGCYLLVQGFTVYQLNRCLYKNGLLPAFFSQNRPLHWAAMTVYFLLILLLVAGAMLPDSHLKFFLQGAGNIWLGFYAYFLPTFMILRVLSAIFGRGLAEHKDAVRCGTVTGCVVFSAVILVYGMIHAQNTIVTVCDVNLEKDGGSMKDMKVVLLADLHLSVNSRLKTTQRMVELVNEQEPDLIVIAGDIFTSTYEGLKNPESYAQALRGMNAKYGVYAVYGNHDVEETLFGGFPVSPISEAFRTEQMEQFFKDCGFTVLYDDTVLLADGAVQLVGRVDGEKAGDGTADRMSASQVLAGIDPEKPVLVLEHEPIDFKALKENGADLALCGHTHAGQIFPGNLIVPFFNENAYGFKTVNGLDTIVTSGVGYYGPPMRVGTNSEVMVVNIHFH